MNLHNNNTNSKQDSFASHPIVRRKKILFKFLFFIGCFILFIGNMGLKSETVGNYFFVNMSFIGIFISISSVAYLILFIKCPQCKSRVYSIKMMWNNRMPFGKNKYCPVCGFPGKDLDNAGSLIRDEITFTYSWNHSPLIIYIASVLILMLSIGLTIRFLTFSFSWISFTSIIIFSFISIVIIIFIRKIISNRPFKIIFKINQLLLYMPTGVIIDIYYSDIIEIKMIFKQHRRITNSIALYLDGDRIVLISKHLRDLNKFILQLKEKNCHIIID